MNLIQATRRKNSRFDKGCEFTDDTVMTIAVADAFMHVDLNADDGTIKASIVYALKYWVCKYHLEETVIL